MNPRHLPHLIKRFFGSLRARRPRPGEQSFIAGHLSGASAHLFAAQAAMDQRHALDIARRIALAAPERRDLIRAALLHDVGKAHSRLGIVGRSLASFLAILRIPVSGRMAAYLDHGALGAADLARVGEGGITIAFAAGHHDPLPPSGVDPGDWAVLRSADGE